MTSKNSQPKTTNEDFLATSFYFGIAIGPRPSNREKKFLNLEKYFLSATLNLTSSRIAEGFLCWLLRYGHLLSPAKIRRLLSGDEPYDPAVLGGFIVFLQGHKIRPQQFDILKPFAKKYEIPRPLFEGPRPSNPDPYFSQFNVITYQYKLDLEKFLTPARAVYKRCSELHNRALFGSAVHADVACCLGLDPSLGPYKIAQMTNNHKARVYEIYEDVRAAL